MSGDESKQLRKDTYANLDKHHYVSYFLVVIYYMRMRKPCDTYNILPLGVRFVERDFVEKHGCTSSCLVSRCSVFDDTASEWYD